MKHWRQYSDEERRALIASYPEHVRIAAEERVKAESRRLTDERIQRELATRYYAHVLTWAAHMAAQGRA